MAWVRIHDGALGHPKIAGMVDMSNPFTLWVWGLTHCQMHLTDGVIVTDTVPRRALKAAGELVRRGLWEHHELGWKVHDYLTWNDCRDKVVAVRTRAKERKDAFLSRRRTAKEQRSEQRTNGVGNAHPTQPNPTQPNKEIQEREKNASLSPSAADPFVNPKTTKRAGSFLERYQELYPKYRKGARYALKPVRDYAAAVTLCNTWEDDERLDKLAVIFLTTDHKFAEEGSRTVPQFLALASWCDGKLAEWEAKKGSAA